MADAHKRRILGYRGKGKTCLCCREVTKRKSHKLARKRLKAADRRRIRKIYYSRFDGVNKEDAYVDG